MAPRVGAARLDGENPAGALCKAPQSSEHRYPEKKRERPMFRMSIMTTLCFASVALGLTRKEVFSNSAVHL